MSPVSISLSADTATVHCETCGGTVPVPTADRGELLAQVRSFLEQHGDCTAHT